MVGVPKSKGCLECRRQKKSCEGKSTPCVRCTRLKIPCVGRGEQRFKFQDETIRFDTSSAVPKQAKAGLPLRSPRSQSTNSQAKHNQADRSQSRDRQSTHSQSDHSHCDHSQSERSQSEGVHSNHSQFDPISPSPPVSTAIIQLPSNKHTRLVASFLYNIDPAVDSSWQPPWSFNGLLEELPKRLGHNAALDASVEAGLAAYQCYRSRRMDPSVSTDDRAHRRSLQHYSKALLSLRESLNDDSVSGSTETLCSTLMLLMYETLGGPIQDKALGHAGGAAHILKARGHLRAKDKFEQTVLLCLRAPVIFKAIFTDEELFSEEEWETFVPSHMPGPHESIMRTLSRVPNNLQRIRKALSGPTINYAALANVRMTLLAVRNEHIVVCSETADRFDRFEKDYPNIPESVNFIKMMHSSYGRHYCTALVTDLHLLSLLSACDYPDVEPPPMLATDRESDNLDSWMQIAASRAAEISVCAERVACHRPLGTFYMDFILKGAYISAGDRATQLRLLGQIYEYNVEMYGGMKYDVKDLAAVHTWFNIGDLREHHALRAKAAMGSIREVGDDTMGLIDNR